MNNNSSAHRGHNNSGTRTPTWVLSSIGTLALMAAPSVAQAGGYDFPVLYSARHAGMGGTAVSYVRDTSAVFHNPAGLGNIAKANLLANFSLLLAGLQGSPALIPSATSIESETITAPAFLIGGAYRFTDWLSVGGAFYPVASSGAEYFYDSPGGQVRDETILRFFEASPAVAVNLPEQWGLGKINIGVSYRIVIATLTRLTQVAEADPLVQFDLGGASFEGFRLGLQWAPVEFLSFGLHYRSKTTTELTAEEGVVTLAPAGTLALTDLSGEFTLPARLSFGSRFDFAGFGVAVDAEYAFQSQNRRLELMATAPQIGQDVTATNVFRWEDAWTVRFGVEYEIKLPSFSLFPRLGYVFDGTTTNIMYPQAFGTAPAPTHSVTAGLGATLEKFEFSFAYSYRDGGETVTPDDIFNAAAGDEQCDLCGFPGDYSTSAHGLYVDISYDFD